MDRKIVPDAQVAIARGHRIEATEQPDPLTGEHVVLAVVDREAGIGYRRAQEPRDEASCWLGRFLECSVTIGGAGAMEAAKAEADRWGGADCTPTEEPQRFS